MNKKALSPEETVAILLIFIIGALILIKFGDSLVSQLKEDADIETCKLSVLAQAQTRKVPGIGFETPGTLTPLDCPRRNLKIFENKVEINGKTSKKYKFEKLSQNEVNRILAEELRLCWYKMAEGNRNIFEQSYFFELSPNICLICSEIEFDDKLKGKSFSGLLDYLKSKKIPKGDITYFEYLVRSQKNLYLLKGNLPWSQHFTPWGYGTTNRVDDDKLNTNEKYLIYFLAYKPDKFNQVIGAFTSAYYIGLGKEDKLTTECSQLVN
ncbi:hypothetical protein HYX03_01460 [Candidatus Woesearchaeota archaeon]|nr:hypothetical protein [Candidatus Woesearchaeota archaeon]